MPDRVLHPRTSRPIVRGVPPLTAEDTKKTWGEQLLAARRESGRTQVQVAEAAGLDQTAISKAERGVGSFETFVAIANTLGVNILGRDL
jgi:hypothetical protein